MNSPSIFRRFAEATARGAGKPAAFLLAAAVVVVWAATGPIFKYNDTWQLVINTGTTIITFLMVFLIQNSQNRDTASLQIKLNELIRASQANDALLNLDDLDEDALERVRGYYSTMAKTRGTEMSKLENVLRELRECGATPADGATDEAPDAAATKTGKEP
ncbi:MAG TPA: low affinity iron permease family protein [Rhodanobacter sp.]|nr:low affinity iron permease family protein [Rhodanobacter sp.]